MQYSYNIIVDSPCEITADFAKANQLKVLHFTYTEGNGDEGLCGVDDLFVSRTAHEFYEAMRNGAAPQTSQPSQHEFESAFREAIESGIPAVYLAFDSGISGCYEGACMALDRLKDEYGAENVGAYRRHEASRHAAQHARVGGSSPARKGNAARADDSLGNRSS